MRRGEDAKFRQQIQSSREYSQYLKGRGNIQLQEAQTRARIMAARDERLKNASYQSNQDISTIIEEIPTLSNNDLIPQTELCMECEFKISPKEFFNAVRPVIKRSLKKYMKSGVFVFEFLHEDVVLPTKTLLWQDSLVIRYQEDGKPIKKAYLTYKPEWKLHSQNGENKNRYLQMGYTFELGEEATFQDILEGIEVMKEFVDVI